ncbi:MAG: histidinol-phosphate transaminase [Bacillota bacterium]
MDYQQIARPQLAAIKPYVPGKPIEEVQRELGITDVIKLASNENPLGPCPEAREAIKKAADKVSLYPDGNVYYLKNALAERLGVEAKNIMVGNGSDEILELLGHAFLTPDSEIIVADPTFSEYEFSARLMGAQVKSIPCRDMRHDLPAMKAAVSRRTKIIFLCNPNNPTGTYVTKAEVDDFLDGLPGDIIVAFDEAYFEYAEAGDYPDGMNYFREGRNVIVLRTFSKIYGLAGLRVGYGVAPEGLIAMLGKVREPFNVNLVAQEAARASLGSSHVEKSRALNGAGKNQLYRAFEKMGLKYWPTETNFILVELPRDCREVFAALQKRGVIIRTGDIYGLPKCIRVTVGNLEQNERFLRELAAVIQ